MEAKQPGSAMQLSALVRANSWLNSPPLTAEALRGKVVLIDFWTYTCVNWLRTLPYVRAWAEKYANQGLVVVGVHTPEFPFEGTLENVRRSVERLRVPYPIALDSDYAIWNAFGNEYWPALYFLDTEGHIRHHHFGEGEYARSEQLIQGLLAEAGAGDVGRDLVSVEAYGAEVAADWDNLRSPESYVGYLRAQNFVAPGGEALDKRSTYRVPEALSLNHWGLSGEWTLREGAVRLEGASGRIAYRFHARDLNLVMGPATPGTALPFRVLIDGQPPGAAHGADIDEHGIGTLSEQRLYQLIRQPTPIADHQFDIEFAAPGAEAFVFTFG